MADDARDLFNIEVDEFQKKAKVNSLSTQRWSARLGRAACVGDLLFSSWRSAWGEISASNAATSVLLLTIDFLF
jgi:hypothetical protein